MENLHVPVFFRAFAEAKNETLTSTLPSGIQTQYVVGIAVTMDDIEFGNINATLLKTNSAGKIRFVPYDGIVPSLLDFYNLAFDKLASEELQSGLFHRVKLWQSGSNSVLQPVTELIVALPFIYDAAQIYGKALKQQDLFGNKGEKTIDSLVAAHKLKTT